MNERKAYVLIKCSQNLRWTLVTDMDGTDNGLFLCPANAFMIRCLCTMLASVSSQGQYFCVAPVHLKEYKHVFTNRRGQ